MATVVTQTATGNPEIDGLLYGAKWNGVITYSFPDSSSDYSYPAGYNEPQTGFAPVASQIQAAINYGVGLVMGYTNVTLQYAGADSADIMVANSSLPSTAYAYLPHSSAMGGDMWFGPNYDWSLAKLGNYQFFTALHEFGHALGLKHAHEVGGVSNLALPSAHDSLEYSIMSYRSYQGGPITGYTNEAYGFPTTFMMNDILALQTMYGADYTTQNLSTVYKWDPNTGQKFINGVAQPAPGGGVGGLANRIFETIWDGGGSDTYDLSNYTTNLSINLNPGASSVFSTTQLANLGGGNYASGNVYNAYLVNNDPRSYIENAKGGSGNDKMIGNAVANTLRGGGGEDILYGEDGADYLYGDDGNDTLYGGAGDDKNLYGGAGNDIIYGDDGNDSLHGDDGDDYLYGGAGGDHLAGGAGNDTLDAGPGGGTAYSGSVGVHGSLLGGQGSDTYLYGKGYGNNVITDLGGVDDKLQFIDLNPADITPTWENGYDSNMMMIVNATGEWVKLTDQGFYIVDRDINSFVFADGTVWNELMGTGGIDSITGTSGHDMISGLEGDDVINGGAGNDVLLGCSGNDTLTGGIGNDRFVFQLGFGNDIITDFSAGAGLGDVIVFSKTVLAPSFESAHSFTDLASVLAKTTQVGTDTVITYDANNTVTLRNVAMTSLHVDDFQFVT